ncbi:MAG TPA: GNAT family N-acetyltransferase [Polyangiaceae bacterium]|nr:GNAT family N-acetyltransferase [Polyangiaceae bacterium]
MLESNPIQLLLDAPLSAGALEELLSAAWPGATQGCGRRMAAQLPHSLCWVSAHAAERLVGFVNVAWDAGVHAFLLDPTVHPEYRRRGIGLALVERAVARARERGLEWMHVDYEPSLAEFYRRSGFGSTHAGLLRLSSPAPSAPADAAPGLALSLARYEPRWLDACRTLLDGLQDWFGGAASAAYSADLARYPSWVAISKDVPAPGLAGCVTVRAPERTAFEVHLLAVERELQGQGVGSALLLVAERFARRCGARFLHVKTLGPSSGDVFYARSQAFYEARGYTRLFESERLWDGAGPALVLVKAL